MTTSLDEIMTNFELIEDWDERYRYLIELGRELEPLPDEVRNEQNKVRGCASQVWIATMPTADGRLEFKGDSDAHIVKGLVRLALAVYSGHTPREIVETDAAAVFEQLGLSQHLTPQRSNGVRSMVDRIRSDARQMLERA